MSSKLNDLAKRLQKLETESEIYRRRIVEDSNKVAKVLSSLDKDMVAEMLPLVPALSLVTEYTAEQIAQNENGELDTIRQVYADMLKYLTGRIEYFESRLESG